MGRKVMHCHRGSCISAPVFERMAMSNGATGLSLIVATLAASSGCIRLPPGNAATAKPAAATERTAAAVVVWDGDEHGGSAKEWANCNVKSSCQSTVQVVPAAGTKGSNGLEWHAKGKDWKGFGWNWFGFYPEDAGTDATKYQNLTFWIRVKPDDPKSAPDLKDLKVGLGSSNKVNVESETVPLSSYADSLSDGEWHEIVVPLADLIKGKGKNFDATKAWELRLGEYSTVAHAFTVSLDNIGFDNRRIISLISLPEKRNPAPLGGEVAAV